MVYTRLFAKEIKNIISLQKVYPKNKVLMELGLTLTEFLIPLNVQSAVVRLNIVTCLANRLIWMDTVSKEN